MTPPPMRVTGLHCYPVKSLAGVALTRSGVDARGLRGDRRWGVVDPDGVKLTAREVPGLLHLHAIPGASGSVTLRDGRGESLDVSPPRGTETVQVGFSGQPRARPAGPEADAWLSARVGRTARLVWQDDETRRPIRPELGGAIGDRNSLSDAAPLHVTSEASLRRLNDWLLETALERGEEPQEPIGHDRFRPNVVVDGDEPFVEDTWGAVRIGDLPFRVTMVCDRCVMTTIDRHDLRPTKEPIRTLARHRRWEGSTWFGIRLTPVLPIAADASISVGDEVLVR